MEILKKSSSVCFATFSPYLNKKRDPKNGNIEPMISFFAKRVKRFVLIDQPHPGSDIVPSVVEEYWEGKLKKKYKLNNFFYQPFYFLLQSFVRDADTSIFYKIRDLIAVLHVGLTQKEKFDYFIGLESVNALGGIILKKLGKVSHVIYYVSDYSPRRYANRIFNALYLYLDRFCCYNADFIWDVSKEIQTARIRAGLDKKKSVSVIHVPNALFQKNIKHLSMDRIIPFSLVFMGSLGYENGPDLAIGSLPYILKVFPKVRLHIVGGGTKEDLLRLCKLVSSLNLKQYVKFYGLIPKDEEMYALIRRFSLGLAPYLELEGSVRLYGDSLKLRSYMASGLPVVTTKIPPLGRELAAFGSAIITKDDKRHLAFSIIKILSDRVLYEKYRNKAIQYGKNNTWENTFNQAFAQMSKVKKSK